MALKYLDERNKSYEAIEYLKATPTEKQLDAILHKLDMAPEELLRKNESDFKEHFKGKELSRMEWIAAMCNFPKLIERPIVVRGEKAVVARPTEKIDDLD
jgi:arsenate reductase